MRLRDNKGRHAKRRGRGFQRLYSFHNFPEDRSRLHTQYIKYRQNERNVSLSVTHEGSKNRMIKLLGQKYKEVT